MGETQKALRITEKMLRRGDSVEGISELTDLLPEKVAELINHVCMLFVQHRGDREMDNRKLKSEIVYYINTLDDYKLPKEYKYSASIILSGSTGWGIKEGKDSRADWDLHIIMTDHDYEEFVQFKGEDYIIDDQDHTPVVFIQFHNIKWLYERLEGNVPNSWPLYLWIYTNCVFVQDPVGVCNIVKSYKNKFDEELPELIKQYHITFSARRLDTCSSALRELKVAAGINRAEMVKAALQTLCLISNEPFVYNKWLSKEVELLYKDNADVSLILDTCDRCLYETDLKQLVQYSKILRDQIEDQLFKKFGDKRWIHYWWEFNKN